MYEAFGLRIRSEIALPIPPLQADTCADVTIRRASVGDSLPAAIGQSLAVVTCGHGTVYSSRHTTELGTLIFSHQVGSILIHPDHQTVTVFPADGEVNPEYLGLFLASQVAIFLRSRDRTPVLHCSAIISGDGAAAFLGDQGQGKSSTAASFLHHGATLLTDDALPVDIRDGHVFGVPGPAIMKLWDASVEHALHLDRPLPSLFEGTPKKLFQLDQSFRMADRPTPLKAIYLLDRRDDDDLAPVEISPLRKADAIGALMRHTSRTLLLIPSEVPALFAAYAKTVQLVAVKRLTYRSGFDRLELLQAAVLEDLRRS